MAVPSWIEEANRVPPAGSGVKGGERVKQYMFVCNLCNLGRTLQSEKKEEKNETEKD
ncbi:MAG: hypothetical protein DDT20_01266 [Firmicutes bacterium]|nr:hypothetical protein [Bacillota bacterium]